MGPPCSHPLHNPQSSLLTSQHDVGIPDVLFLVPKKARFLRPQPQLTEQGLKEDQSDHSLGKTTKISGGGSQAPGDSIRDLRCLDV